MDAQTLQKPHRLQRRIASLGILTLVGLTGCARALRMDTDLSVAPKEYEQKIVAVDITVLDNKVPHPASAPVSAASAKKISKKKKTLKIVASASSASVPVVRPQVVRAWPVGIGEQSKYSLRWGVIEGGVATIRVNPPQDIEGVPALHYSGIVKSSKMMDFFYKIDNTIDTWVRLSDLAPLRQEIKQNESARFGRRVMMINPEKNEVKFYEILTKTTGGTNEDKRTDIMLNGSQDLFGALYFYRFVQNIEGAYKYPIHDKGKNWFAELKLEERETIRVPAGIFKSKRYKVAPRLEGQLEPKGDVVVWVTDDDRNLLLKFNAKIKVGSVTGELIEHTPGQPIALVLPHLLTPIEVPDPVAPEATEAPKE